MSDDTLDLLGKLFIICALVCGVIAPWAFWRDWRRDQKLMREFREGENK